MSLHKWRDSNIGSSAKEIINFQWKSDFEFLLSAIINARGWISFLSVFLPFPSLSMIVKRRVFGCRCFSLCGLLPVLGEHFFIHLNFFIYNFHLIFWECCSSGFWWSLSLCQSCSHGLCRCCTGTWGDLGVGIVVDIVTWGDRGIITIIYISIVHPFHLQRTKPAQQKASPTNTRIQLNSNMLFQHQHVLISKSPIFGHNKIESHHRIPRHRDRSFNPLTVSIENSNP